jgi:AraC-like DNA-binding protein
MREATVVAAAPKAFVEFAVERGADRATLLRRAGVHPHGLVDPNGRVAIDKYAALMEVGVELSGEPALPLKFGQHVLTEDLSIVPFVVLNAENTADMRSRMNRYSRLLVDDGEDDGKPSYALVQEGRTAWIQLTSPLYARYPLMTESAVARLVCGVRSGLKSMGGPFAELRFPVALRFTFPEPAYRKEYDRLFGVPIAFNSSMNAIGVDPAFLSVPPAKPFSAAAGVATDQAEKLLARLERPEPMRSQVEQALWRAFESGQPDVRMSTIARRLELSRATLFRRLKAEGATFDEVLERLRHRLAVRLLTQQQKSVRETARLLGYSEASAFSRAFTRWTGRAPGGAAADTPSHVVDSIYHGE